MDMVNVFSALDVSKKKKNKKKAKKSVKKNKVVEAAKLEENSITGSPIFAPSALPEFGAGGALAWADEDNSEDEDGFSFGSSMPPMMPVLPPIAGAEPAEEEDEEEVESEEEEEEVESEEEEEEDDTVENTVGMGITARAPTAKKVIVRQISKKAQKKASNAELDAILAEFATPAVPEVESKPTKEQENTEDNHVDNDDEDLALLGIVLGGGKKKTNKKKKKNKNKKKNKTNPNPSTQVPLKSNQAPNDIKDVKTFLANKLKKKPSKSSLRMKAAAEKKKKKTKVKDKSHYNQTPQGR